MASAHIAIVQSAIQKSGCGPQFSGNSLLTETVRHNDSLVLNRDYRIQRLDRGNVCSNKGKARDQGKLEGERLFQGLLTLLRANFPLDEIETEAQYRRYFFDKYSDYWHVEVAVDKGSNVIGASLYSDCREAGIIMYNIVAVKEGDGTRRKGVARSLVGSMMETAAGNADVRYVMGEIEQPMSSLDDAMRNEVRPAFHDSVTRLMAIRTPSSAPLIYTLPVMSDGSEPVDLMFCLRPVGKDSSEGIGSKEAAKLLIWFYKDYLEAECSDVKPDEVNFYLAKALAQLASDVKAEKFQELLAGGKKNRKEIIGLVPENGLGFMTIREAAV